MAVQHAHDTAQVVENLIDLISSFIRRLRRSHGILLSLSKTG
jgi:hypothetical protein